MSSKNNKEQKKPKLKGKRPKPLTVKVADYLIKKHEENEKLRTKKINTKVLDLF